MKLLRLRLRRYLPSALLLGVVGLILLTFRQVLVPFILALIIVYLIEPLVRRLHKLHLYKGYRIPRWSAVVTVYVGFLFVATLFTALIVPPLVREFTKLASDAPRFLEQVRREHIPWLNNEVQSLIGRFFPSELEEMQVLSARELVYEAFETANTVAQLQAQLALEEVGDPFFDRLALLGDDARSRLSRKESVAFRLRADPITGDLMVILQDIELVSHPSMEGGFLLRSRPEGERDSEGSRYSGPHVDLEKQFNETLNTLVERSGEGMALIISLGQGLAMGLVAAFMSVVLTFMVAAFISIDLPRLMDFVRNTIPKVAQQTYDHLLVRMDKGLSGVVRGQLLICLANGVITGVGLLLFDVKFALILAVFVAAMTIIPIFGSVLSTIPCVAMALTDGFANALLVLVWILMTSFIEANFLNPKIIGTQAHIHPAIVIFALMAGGSTYGLLGALLAVPVTSIFLVIFNFILTRTMERRAEAATFDSHPPLDEEEPVQET